MAGMYSLNDITNGCPIKIETTVSSCNGQSNGIISINGMPVLKAEKSETPCNTVDHHTISLPQESIYEVALNPDEDVLSIQISNVQGATSDHNAVKDELIAVSHVQLENHAAKDEVLTVNQIANHVEKLGNEEVQSRFEVDPQTKIPLAERFPGGQQSKNMIIPEQRYPVETEVQSPVNQSNIHNGEPLPNAAEQQKELPFQLNSHEPEIVPSYHLNHQPDVSQMNNQYPSSAYQMSTNGTISAYQVDTQGTLSSYQNGSPEIVSSYQISTNMALPSVYTSTPLYHMANQGEMLASQPGNFETNTSYQLNHHTEIPAYYGGYNSYNPQQTKQFSQTETHGMIPNQQRSAHNCNCCCHAQNESSHYPVFGVEAPRPSVIMVPVNRLNTSSGTSHVPFKVKYFVIVQTTVSKEIWKQKLQTEYVLISF